MAHQMVKPYSLLFYLLGIIASFFIGLTYAGITDAGKNQGLAGGAIVLGYGVIAAGIGLIIALFVAYKANRKIIFRLNIILALCIAGFYAYYHIKFLEKQKEQDKQNMEQPKKETAPSTVTEPTAMLFNSESKMQESSMGLGMFSPNMFNSETLYFYGNLNLEKSLIEHVPTDSITFKKSEYGSFDIATAPPWFVPDHLKLDYDILYFKVVSVTKDFLEVVVNTSSHQTAFVYKGSGVLKFWPEFLLSINSVEFINKDSQKVYVKPLDHAGTVNTSYGFMKPLRVQQNWMYVLLLNDGFEVTGKGWIKWQGNNQLLITYNLLS